MSTTTTPSAAAADASSIPLLRSREGEGDGSTTHPSTLALLLGRATGRRGPSILVRETAARELEERRAHWGYSKPVVALDILWNIAFILISFVLLIFTTDERPNTPLRVWICGYSLQCCVHVILVWIEYTRRRRRGRGVFSDEERGFESDTFDSDDDDDDDDDEESDLPHPFPEDRSNMSSVAKRFESVNTMASFLWWIIGFYWVVSGGDELLQCAPRLYWLAVVFLAFDVFFAIFCVVLACLIGIALCCCLPCIIAILYAVAGQEGASEADLSLLPKYIFKIFENEEKVNFGVGSLVPMDTRSGYLENRRVLLPEDAECCICLCSYEDGVELHALPCSHHFHSHCIVKWLKMNATCPLCKYNILKGNE